MLCFSALGRRQTILSGTQQNGKASKSSFTTETWQEKKIDTDVVATMMEDSYELVDPNKDEMTLVAGDADYVPAIEKLKKRKIQVHIVFWNHAAKDLRDAAAKFIALDPYLDYLRLDARYGPIT